MDILERFHIRYLDILNAKEPTRTNRLANLMTDMERTFEIPMLRSVTEFKKEYPEIMKLYKSVSNSRNL